MPLEAEGDGDVTSAGEGQGIGIHQERSDGRDAARECEPIDCTDAGWSSQVMVLSLIQIIVHFARLRMLVTLIATKLNGMGQQQGPRMIRRLFALGAAAFFMASGVFLLSWTTVPGLAFPAANPISSEKSGGMLVITIQSPGDPGDWCPPGMSLCDASVCCKKGWRCCRGGCCPPQFRWACDTKRKCYRTKRAALRDGCPAYAVSICIKPRWAD